MNSSRKTALMRALLCVAAAVAAMAAAYFIFGSRFETNDDAAMANIAAGAFGESSERLVFVNSAVGFLIKLLYSLARAPWYYFVSLALDALALGALGFVATKRLGGVTGIFVYGALLVSVGFDVVSVFQFTKNAALMLAGGLALVADSLGETSPRLFCGMLLALLGSMFRFDIAFAAAGVFLPALVFLFLKLDKKKKSTALCSLLVLALAVCGAHFADRAYYENDPSWRGYLGYNEARSGFLDYSIFYAKNRYDYFDYGVTDAEMATLYNWDTYDPDFFTEELFEQLSAATETPSVMQSAAAFAVGFPGMFFSNVYCVPLLAFLAAILLCKDRRRALFSGATVLLSLGGMLYISFLGRLIVRAEEAVVLCTAAALMLLLPREVPKLVKYLPALALAAVIPFALVQKQSNDYYLSTRLSSGENWCRRYSDDKSTLCIMDSSAFDGAMGYDVLRPKQQGYFSNIVFLGGWLSESGFQRDALASFGEKNPYEALIDSSALIPDNSNIYDIAMYTALHFNMDAGILDNGDGTWSVVTSRPAPGVDKPDS